jgi:hypothetical protein
MADDDVAAAAAVALQRATCADVTDKLNNGASADEAAALFASLAVLFEEWGEVLCDSLATKQLACALAASQRAHADHAGAQQEAIRLWYWVFAEVHADSPVPARDEVFDMLLAAARTHASDAPLQRTVWKVLQALAQDDVDSDDDEGDGSPYCMRMRPAAELLLAALRAHMADSLVVVACLDCLSGLTADVVLGASDTIFEAFRTHVGGDAASARGVWRALHALLLRSPSGDTPVVDAVYAAASSALAAAQQSPESVDEAVLSIMKSLAQRKYSRLDCCSLLDFLVQLLRRNDVDSMVIHVCEALRAMAALAAHPAAAPILAAEVEIVVEFLQHTRSKYGVLTGGACSCLAAIVQSSAANAAVVAATDAFDAALEVMRKVHNGYSSSSGDAAHLLRALLGVRNVKHSGTVAEATRRVARACCAAIKADKHDRSTAACLETLLACANKPDVPVDTDALVEVAVSTLSASKRADSLAAACALLARVLSLQSADARARVADSGALAALLRAMSKHANDARLQQQACMACKCLCAARPGACAAADIIGPVAAALAKHAAASRILCMCGASLLGDLADDADDAESPAAHWMIALTAVADAMRALPSDEAVQKHGCAAVSKLAELVDDPERMQHACGAVLDAMAACHPRMLPGGFATVFSTRMAHGALTEAHRCILPAAFEVVKSALHTDALQSHDLQGALDVCNGFCSFVVAEPEFVTQLLAMWPRLLRSPHCSIHSAFGVLAALNAWAPTPRFRQLAVDVGCVEAVIKACLRDELPGGLVALCILLSTDPDDPARPDDDACARAEAAGMRQLMQKPAAGQFDPLVALWNAFTAGVAAALVAEEDAEAEARNAAAQRKRERNRKKKDKRVGRAAGEAADDQQDDVNFSNAATADAPSSEMPTPAVAVVAASLEHQETAVAAQHAEPHVQPLPPLPPLPPFLREAMRSAPPPIWAALDGRTSGALSSSPAQLLGSQLLPPPPATSAADGASAALLASQSAQLRALEAQLAAQTQRAQQAAAALAKLEAERACVICLDAPRCVGLLPCRHLTLCDSAACAAMLGAPPLCPTCRERVADTVRLFV